MIIIILSILTGYLIGAIPTSYIVVKIKKGEDIRKLGSGNPGATNVARALGNKWGFFVLFLDMCKGIIPIVVISFVVSHIKQDTLLFSQLIVDNKEVFKIGIGIMTILGHIFPIYLGFKGGKGVATTIGVFVALVPVAMLITAIVMIVIIAISGYVSLGSIVGAIILPILLIIKHSHISYIIMSVVVGLLIIYRHKANIKRLLTKTESKFSIKK